MYMMTESFWGTVKSVITESGLCVFKGQIGMYEIGVYESAVTEKSRLDIHILCGPNQYSFKKGKR